MIEIKQLIIHSEVTDNITERASLKQKPQIPTKEFEEEMIKKCLQAVKEHLRELEGR